MAPANGLARQALKNAKSLSSGGSLCGEAGFYGHACSLFVLSVEEAVKAVFSRFLSERISLDPALEIRYLRNHEARLRFGQACFFVTHLIVEGDPVGEELQRELVQSRVVDLLKELHRMSAEEIESVRKASGAQWWANANVLKQKGFYTDSTGAGEVWTSPGSVDT